MTNTYLLFELCINVSIYCLIILIYMYVGIDLSLLHLISVYFICISQCYCLLFYFTSSNAFVCDTFKGRHQNSPLRKAHAEKHWQPISETYATSHKKAS